MGIVNLINNELFVFEAVQSVKLTPIMEWINQGVDSKYVVKRLSKADKLLTKENLRRMWSVGENFKGKNYDVYFEWSDENIYCSELVWKIYEEGLGIEIGELELLSSFDLSSELVQRKMKERYGSSIPFDEKVISPVNMFNSDKLIVVAKN